MDLLKKTFYILGDYRKRLPFLIFLFFIVSMMDVLGIGLIGPFVGLLVHEGNISESYGFISSAIGVVDNYVVITALGVLLVFIFITKGVVSFYVQRRMLAFGYQVRSSLVDRLIRSYQSMRYEEILLRDLSTLIVNTNAHVGLFVDSVLVPALRMIIEIIVISGIVMLVAITNPYAMIGVLAILSIILFVYFMFVKARLYKYGRIMSNKEASIIDGVKHVIGAFREVRLLGVEDYFNNGINRDVVEFGKAGVITRSLHLVSRYLIESAMVMFVVGVVIYMIFDSKSNEYIFATLGVFAVGAVRLVPSVSQLGLGIANIRTGTFALDSLYDEISSIVHTRKYESHSDSGLDEMFLSIELKNVAYTYPGQKSKVFSGVDMRIDKGDFVGIVGKSGSGKSTVMDVMLGMLTLTEGELVLNGVSVINQQESNERIRWWQNKCAFIPQDVFLANGTIKSNISFGVDDDDIDYNVLKSAIRAASLDEVLSGEDGLSLDSDVGDQGAKLSGGQKQRIALARAFYAKREIVFMDEATSALDEVTEKEVMNYLDSIKGEITIILITHRMSAIKNCNKVFRVDDGKIFSV